MAPAYDSDRNTLQVQDLKRTDTKINEPTVVVEFVNSEEGFSGLSSRWSAIREIICEPVAEFFGVMLLVIFGAGVNCQVTLSSSMSVSASPKGDYMSVCFGWAAGIALGAWVSGGISGGHINPAVTLAFATLRDFPWRKVPTYILAQLLGGICGAGIVYANYIHAIDAVEGGRSVRTVPGTASLFGTYAADYMTAASCFFEEFLGTAILLMVICAVTDKRNNPLLPGLVPVALFVTILGVAAALGMQTGFALNPARDFGPRLLTAMVGYGREVFNFRSQYWLWCPILAPILGAFAGTFVYDAFFFRGPESIFNRRRTRATSDSEKSIAESSV